MYRKLSIFLFIISVFISCNKIQKEVLQTNSVQDSLVSTYLEHLTKEPEKIKNLILDTLPNTTDSMFYYKLVSVLGAYYYNENRLDSSAYLNESIIKFLLFQDETQEINILTAKIYNNLGAVYLAENKKDSAITCYHKSIESYYKTNDHHVIPLLYIHLADAYNLNGNFLQATSTYRRALVVSDSLSVGDHYKYAIYNGLGRIYTDLRNFVQADYYFNLVEQDWDQVSLFDKYFFSNSRSTYYYTLKEYEKSLAWLYEAQSAASEFNYPIYEATVDMNLGEIHLLLNHSDSAKYYIDKAAGVFLSPYAANSETAYYLDGMYAAVLLHDGKLNQAEQLLMKPYDLSTINPTYVYYNGKRLEELYNRKKNYEKAYEYRKRVDHYDDSLRNITIQNNIAEIDSRYRQDTLVLKRDMLIMRQQQRVSSLYSTNILIITCMVILVLAFIVASLYVRRKREKRFSRQMAKITQLRMDNIRNRVSPHFMYNVLNAVLPPLKQHEELTAPLDLLLKSVRNSLLASDKIAIPLCDEVDVVKDYISLRESIHDALPVINWEIALDVDMQVLIPSMSIQIPVENAIKYAFSSADPDNRISVVITKDTENITITVEDNGKGFTPAMYTVNTKGTGNGLKIMYQTIELFNTRNQNKMVFSIDNLSSSGNNKHGTRVCIKIPLDYNYTI